MQSITIEKAIAHEVVKHKSLVSGYSPESSDQLMPLEDRDLKELIERRLNEVLGSGSHSVEMEIDKDGEGSCFTKMISLLDKEEADFVDITKGLARDLSSSQVTGAVKAGVAIFITGKRYSSDSLEGEKFTCVIKADSSQAMIQDGVSKLNFKYAASMILSEQQRLLKVGFFCRNGLKQNPSGKLTKKNLDISIFDHLITPANESSGAAYFYKTFLGCKPLASAKIMTKKFHSSASDYIDRMNVDNETKVEKKNCLTAYMKSTSGTISTREFAENWMPQNLRDDFSAQMKNSGVSTKAIHKDNSLIKNKLRIRKWTFSSKVKLIVPEGDISSYIKIGNQVNGWTKVEIHGDLESQE